MPSAVKVEVCIAAMNLAEALGIDQGPDLNLFMSQIDAMYNQVSQISSYADKSVRRDAIGNLGRQIGAVAHHLDHYTGPTPEKK